MQRISMILTSIFVWLASTSYVFAQSGGGTGAGGGGGTGTGGNGGSGGATSLNNPLGNQTLIGFFQDILDVIMVFAVPIIVFFIIYAGFLYVTARGNEEQVKNATRALTYAVIGGVIILGANVLLDVIAGTVDALGA